MRFAKSATRASALAAMVCVLALTACQPGGRNSVGEPNTLSVTSSDPLMSTQNAYLDQSITIQFNQDIDPNTVNEGTVQVTGPAGTVNGTYITNFSQVVFTPLLNFATNTTYTVTVPGWSANPFCILSVKGDGLQSAYVLTFQTGTQYVPDTDPPSVIGISVSNGGTTLVPLPIDNSTTVVLDISPATSVIVDFDEGMSPSSFSPMSFSLIDQNNPTTPLPGTFRYFNKNQRVVFYPTTTNPGGFLSLSSNYTLLLTSTLTDNSLNPAVNTLAPAPIQAAFRTRASWNSPSGASPYAEDFSSTNMLDPTMSNAIWNSVATAQRLEGGYGAAALAGSGVDGDFTPTQTTVLSTSTRPFGYQYNVVDIPMGVVVTVSGSRPGIIRARGNMTIRGIINADGGPGISVSAGNAPAAPGGTGGPGGSSGGSGSPNNINLYPWRSDPGAGPSGGTGGLWSTQTWSTGGQPPWWWWGVTTADLPGSGGGGGNSSAGTNGTGSNLGAPAEGVGGGINTSGNPGASGFQLVNGGGSGGGGGGGGDDGGTPNPGLDGDGVLAYPPDDGGAGGGGGGGAINLTCAALLVISGQINARGGIGGNNITNGTWPPGFGVGGGGGSGGCILVQGLTVNVGGATFNVRGGAGGIGGYTGWGGFNSIGGRGGDGWIRFESVSGTIIGEASAILNPNTSPAYSKGTLNLSTTQAQSLFFDTQVEDPDYIDNLSFGFTANVVLNSGTIQIYAQGADADSRGQPDAQTYWPNTADNQTPSWALLYDSTTATPYQADLNQLDRYRFIRFRAVFGNLLNVYPPGPYVNDLTFPFKD